MRTAFFRYALLAGLLAASLGASAPAASGSPTGGAMAGSATSGSTSSTPAASGSPSGGAAPTSKLTLATWFGPGFYGHATACGQTMSPTLVGVASRTLPCGTLVQVGFRGHLLTVPVLDRGPYGHNGATWDLTRGAAQALEIKETVRVSTQIVGHVANTPTLGEPEPSAAGAPSGPLTPAPATAASTGGATAG
jgi:rare lipoprotein A (peptidoglycan hydrolase)